MQNWTHGINFMVWNSQYREGIFDMVICDSCNHEFEIELHTRKLDGDIEENYFTCPSCNSEYVSFKTSKETRELNAKLDKENKRYNKAMQSGNVQAAKKRWNSVQKLRKKLKRAMEKIN